MGVQLPGPAEGAVRAEVRQWPRLGRPLHRLEYQEDRQPEEADGSGGGVQLEGQGDEGEAGQ